MHKKLPIALVLTLSACAGELDDSLNYQTPAPVADASVARTAEAGRAPVADAGAPRTPQAGRAATSVDKPAMNTDSNNNKSMSMNMSSNMTKKDDDAGAGEPAAPQMPAAMACDFRAIIEAKCGNASCHGAPGSVTGLDLTTAMLAARVEGRKGKGTCTDKLLVDVDNPRQSKLYLKVSGSTCGSQMPLGGMLTSDEQACVLTWIEKL
ncbi:MAG TPA: hypothetical protein VFN67_05390 [Polyangiales bacterium]|jgi:hypothetical protein|nr:hypothetical protein [Polyangiales bacterium]